MPARFAENIQTLRGHALRNFNLRRRSLARSVSAPPLAKQTVEIRVNVLKMTRIQLARESGISRGALRDLELGVHTPTRHTLERFIEFCESQQVPPAQIESLRNLYAGPVTTLRHLIARMELRAGSSPQLARRIGISAATLWEYKRGNFPVPYSLLKKMCQAVGEDFSRAEQLWHDTELKRFVERGFPEAMAELCILRLRAGHAESKLLELGLGTSQLRRLCYLELLPWPRIAPIAKNLCRDEAELKHLRELWQQEAQLQRDEGLHDFGLRLKKLRDKRGITRREIADLFLIGGKKPARTVKHIEEDGHYSQRAFPGGLVALLTEERNASATSLETHVLGNGNGNGTADQFSSNGYLNTGLANELRQLWERRRLRFHLRHRPEMQIDLRLQREYFGFDIGDAARLLGYSSLEYQKIERGIEPLSDSARKRILTAFEEAGHRKIHQLFQRRTEREERRAAWKSPSSVSDMLVLLAQREGGIVPLGRLLKRAGLFGISTPQLRAYVVGHITPTWHLIQQIADTCGVSKLQSVHLDWIRRFRAQLQARNKTLLAVELKLLMAEVSPTLRAFAKRLPFNYSVLLRDLYRVEAKIAVKWAHVERVLKAAGLPDSSERWRVIHRLWLKGE